MLFFYFFKQSFIVFFQSGFYLDFFLKKISEIFIKNIFIYSSLFFGEKYFIEVLTKKIIDNFIFLKNKKTFLTYQTYTNFFNIFVLFIIFLINLFIVFFLLK
jgi:hypothetical protein